MQTIELLLRTLRLCAVSTFEFYPFKKQTNVFAAFEEEQGFQSWRFYAKVAVFRASWRPKIRGYSPPKKWRFSSIFKIVKKVAILVRFGPKSGDF